MIKKVLFIRLGVILALAVMSGCGSDNNAVVTTTTVPGVTTTTSGVTTTTSGVTTTTSGVTTTTSGVTTTTSGVTTTTVATTTTTLAPVVTAVTGAGTVTATQNQIFQFAADNYTYNIAGFSVGNGLIFPTNATTVFQNTALPGGGCSATSCPSGATITLQWAVGGSTVTVDLTGLTYAQASSILTGAVATSGFTTVFGANSVTP